MCYFKGSKEKGRLCVFKKEFEKILQRISQKISWKIGEKL